MPLGEWRDYDRRHPCSWPPAIDLRRRYVVPDAAILGVGDDDHRIVPYEALLDLIDDRRGVIVATHHAGIPRMLVVRADRLVEADGGKCSVPDRTQHFSLVLEVLGASRRAGGVVREIGERLMMIDEGGVWMAGDRTIEAAGIPRPETPASVSRLPIVGIVCNGRN